MTKPEWQMYINLGHGLLCPSNKHLCRGLCPDSLVLPGLSEGFSITINRSDTWLEAKVIVLDLLNNIASNRGKVYISQSPPAITWIFDEHWLMIDDKGYSNDLQLVRHHKRKGLRY